MKGIIDDYGTTILEAIAFGLSFPVINKLINFLKEALFLLTEFIG